MLRLLLPLRAAWPARTTDISLWIRGLSSMEAEVRPPYRSMIFIPNDSERKLRKASSVDVDACILDFEDGVAQNRKAAARQTYASIRSELKIGHGMGHRSAVTVRLNAHTLEEEAVEDLRTILSTDLLPDGLVLSKVDTADAFDWLDSKWESLSSKKPTHSMPVFTMVETAKGVMNLERVCEHGGQRKFFHHEGLIFGYMDYCADIGADASSDLSEIVYARQKLVNVGKAFGLQAVDHVWPKVKDLDGFRDNCLAGRRMGFTGKSVIHPSHVAIANKAFFPPNVDWAERLIKAFEEHKAAGKGTFLFEEEMVDQPLLTKATSILALAQKYRSLEER